MPVNVQVVRDEEVGFDIVRGFFPVFFDLVAQLDLKLEFIVYFNSLFNHNLFCPHKDTFFQFFHSFLIFQVINTIKIKSCQPRRGVVDNLG